MSFITFKYRIKSGERRLNRLARACNQVWNFCVATQREAERRRKGGANVRWPTAFDLINLTSGSSVQLGVNSDTVGQVCMQFAKSRDQSRQCPRFRSSFGSRKSLGWAPFQARAIKVNGDCVTYLRRDYRFWKSREAEGVIKSGAFVQDARGRWYVTLQCEVADERQDASSVVGIDLGLKELATLSTGQKVPALQHYRLYEAKLAIAQRSRNKRRVRAIHAKIANARRHHLHEQSTKIANENSLIVVGNVNAAAIAKTRLAKSVLDAGWSTFRHMLRYKAARRQAVYVEADERYSSQTCSCCGAIPASSPKGMGALGMRRWECDECGADHDRDVNAARNILRVGLEHQPPVGEITRHLPQWTC